MSGGARRWTNSMSGGEVLSPSAMELLESLPPEYVSAVTEALKSLDLSPQDPLDDDHLTQIFREVSRSLGKARAYQALYEAGVVRGAIRVKAFVVGDAAVGKTTFCVKLATGKFKEEYKMTVGVDFYTLDLVSGGRLVKLVLWDLAGQERFGLVRPNFYAGSSGGFIAFALDRPETLRSVPGWVREMEENVGGRVPAVLIGTKLDLSPSLPEASNVAEELGLLGYVPVSSKTGENLMSAVRMLISACVNI